MILFGGYWFCGGGGVLKPRGWGWRGRRCMNRDRGNIALRNQCLMDSTSWLKVDV